MRIKIELKSGNSIPNHIGKEYRILFGHTGRKEKVFLRALKNLKVNFHSINFAYNPSLCSLYLNTSFKTKLVIVIVQCSVCSNLNSNEF